MNMFGWMSLHTPINWKERVHSKEKLLDMIIIPRGFCGGVEYRWEPDDDHMPIWVCSDHRHDVWHLRLVDQPRVVFVVELERPLQLLLCGLCWQQLERLVVAMAHGGGWGKKEFIGPFFSTYFADYLVELLEIQIAIVVGVQTAERQNIKKTREQFTKKWESPQIESVGPFLINWSDDSLPQGKINILWS